MASVLVVAGLVAAAASGAALRPADPASCLADPSCDYVLVLAHRGASLRAPENTVLALKLAERLGADAVEVDVRPTRDGVLVLMHDSTVDRTTDGVGRLSELDLADLRTLRAASPCERVAPQPIPTFVEALRALGPSTLVNVDAKTDRIDLIYADLKAASMLDRAWVQTTGPARLEQLCAAYPGLMLQPNAKTSDDVAALAALAPRTVEFPAKLTSGEPMAACRSFGCKPSQNALGPADAAASALHAEGGDSSLPYLRIAERGALIIQTDRPGLAAAALAGLNAQRRWARVAPASPGVGGALPSCE